MSTVIAATAVSSGTPILLAGLGELVAERSGILNLGVEGMMLVGALAGFATAHATGSALAGAAAATGAGALFALVHAWPTVRLGVDQVVSGLALVILGAGIASAFGRPLVGQVAASFHPVPVPVLSRVPVVGPVFFDHDPIVYLGLLLIPAVAWFVARTRSGLALQVCGEAPRFADVAGLPVERLRIRATCFGGALAGLGGAWLSLADTPSWVDQMTAGRGWIAVAMVVFSGWSPGRLALGAWLFGGLVAVQFRIQAFGVHADVYLLKMLPYVCTLAVLVLAARGRWRLKLGAPAALGRPYRREGPE
ncbi:MAG: ABC transporter permease [Deltaproteobacteria bacterium]|nr:ABC transporter permease [Deltaproteobacteria bacterium]